MIDDDKKSERRIIEPQPSLVHYLHNRPYPNHFHRQLPTFAEMSPQLAVCRNLVCSFKNKKPSPVFSVQWTNHGKRAIIGCDSGEFLLWSGINFKYESLIQVHTYGVRTMK